MTEADQIYFEAKQYEAAGEHRKAFALYNVAAEQGCVSAYSCVGMAYLNGEGTELDYQKAVKWFRKGEAEGNATCINNLGFCYSMGYGVPQDKQKALQLYWRAAKDNQSAKENYAQLYIEFMNKDPESGFLFVEDVDPKSAVGMRLSASVVLAGPDDGATVLPVKVPEYGMDFYLALPNDTPEFWSTFIDKIPSSVKPNKSYDINFMFPKVRRKSQDLQIVPDEDVVAAQRLKEYCRSNDKFQEEVGAVRVYGPVEKTPTHLLVAVDVTITGVRGIVAPIKLPQYGVEIHMAIPYNLAENKPLLIKGVQASDGSGRCYDLTVVPTKVQRKAKQPSPYYLKQMEQADPKEYVRRLRGKQRWHRKQLEELEQRGLLEKAALELFLLPPYEIGKKAVVSQNFLFHKNKRGLIIPCEDIFWFFDDDKGNFYVGTRYHGIQKISKFKKSGYSYKKALNEAIDHLRERTTDLLVGDTPENEVQYNRRIHP